MPHMMPMMWTIIYIFSIMFLFILMMMIHFFYLPKLTKNPIIHLKSYKWNWMW